MLTKMTKLKHPKAKGTRFENEVIEEFKKLYVFEEGVRCWGSDGRSRGLPKEVDVVITMDQNIIPISGEKLTTNPFWIQCKSIKQLPQWLGMSENIDAVIFKENRGKKYIMMELTDFIQKCF